LEEEFSASLFQIVDHDCGFKETLDQLAETLFQGYEFGGGVWRETGWGSRVG
jgi:hypothetical protein